MDCTGREGTEETFEREDTRRSNLQSSKAHARCTQAKGAQSWNFDWTSSASKEANSAGLTERYVLALRHSGLLGSNAKDDLLGLGYLHRSRLRSLSAVGYNSQ